MVRILIIKLGALGDVIIASAAIRQLLKQHQDDQVELLTTHPFAHLFENFPQLNVITLPRTSWSQQLHLGWGLRRHRYQRIYDLQGNDRSRALTFIISARERIGLWPGWPYQITPTLPRKQKQHPFQRINALLKAAGCQTASVQLPQLFSNREREQVKNWLQQRQLDQQSLALLHAGCSARWQSKRWPEAAFIELAKRLTERGLSVVWLGGPDEDALNIRLSAEVGVNACGEFTIPALVALAEQAKLAITNDSGPMHILSAANIPIYSFFGPTSWQLSHAVGQADRVLTANIDCSPCFQPQCPLQEQQRHRCMKELTPQQVMTRLRSDGFFQ